MLKSELNWEGENVYLQQLIWITNYEVLKVANPMYMDWVWKPSRARNEKVIVNHLCVQRIYRGDAFLNKRWRRNVNCSFLRYLSNKNFDQTRTYKWLPELFLKNQSFDTFFRTLIFTPRAFKDFFLIKQRFWNIL